MQGQSALAERCNRSISGVQGTALESPWRGMLLATYNLAIPPLTFGSLRPGLWCSLTARGYFDDGRIEGRILDGAKTGKPAPTLILRDKRKRIMV